MSTSITQDMAYRQSLMKYAEKYGVSRASRKYNKSRSSVPAESTTKAGRISTSGGRAGMEMFLPWPASPGVLTAIRTSTPKQN